MGEHDKNRGLYDKFVVKRTDGRDAPGQKHEKCSYFVMDLTHDKHAIPALMAYALSCKAEFPTLAADLLQVVAFSQRPGGPDRYCSVCGEIQVETDSGAICVNGHGGAPAKEV